MAGLLNRDRSIAGAGFNRWLVPPAALAIQLSIGMAYGFSVFWLPLSHVIGITKQSPLDWKISSLMVTYTLFFILLGSSAAIFGPWVEANGPRKAGVIAAFCWGGGFFISALGVYHHQIILLWIGSGFIGGCGLGLGYISPVSTLIKWFPDKRGLAVGMAIMGFGGGAMIGAPLADKLMKHYSTTTSVGVWETFVTLGSIYFVAMMCGAFTYRIPQVGWKPHGWTPPVNAKSTSITDKHVHIKTAHRVPQFWLLWGVLCLNASASIGILGLASPMLQEVFGGRLIGLNGALLGLNTTQAARVATFGAAFAGLLSIFNIVGRIFWASLSDQMGRRRTFTVFFLLGMALYLLAAYAGITRNIVLFIASFCIIISMYGGGFATIPAYLADLFGTKYVGEILGRLLTAWSTAGILGPLLVGFIREAQDKNGLPKPLVYSTIFYLAAGLLFLGLVSNLLIRPVQSQHFMEDGRIGEGEKKRLDSIITKGAHSEKPSRASWVAVIIGWALVGVPLAWGLFMNIHKAAPLFR